jgi:hypothetical protein
MMVTAPVQKSAALMLENGYLGIILCVYVYIYIYIYIFINIHIYLFICENSQAQILQV